MTDYVTVDGVADYYKVSPSTVRNWVKSGQIPSTCYLKLNNTYRFVIADVDKALRGKTQDAVAAIQPDPRQLELDFSPDDDI
jgi:excisionase family DNA binding protein